jgi:hypothetical protein
MRIRNFDLEESRADQFFRKLCKDLLERFPAPDLGVEVSRSQIYYKNVDAAMQTLSIVDKGLHVFIVEHGADQGNELEVMIVNMVSPDKTIGNQGSIVYRRLGIKNVKLSQLEIISRMVMSFFLDWCEVENFDEIIAALYGRIADQPDLRLVAYGSFHNREDLKVGRPKEGIA